MGLSDEDRQRIYEEEQAYDEARKRIKTEKQQKTLKGCGIATGPP